MKAYGLPRFICIQHPDLVDGRTYALKSSRMNVKGKGGDIHSNFRSSTSKRQMRRLYKRIARSKGRQECQMIDYNVEGWQSGRSQLVANQ